MYNYRRMTADQRHAIVSARREKNFPLHEPPHLDQGDGWYFISAACFEHKHHFQGPHELTALSQRLLDGFQDAAIPIAGWVVLPNHYHILAKVSNIKHVGAIVGPVHGRSGRYANKRDNEAGRRVWYKFADRKIRSERHFWTCIHYMLMNPVKHAFSETQTDWAWSCYHELLAEHGSAWIANLQHDFPLLDFGKNWDDF